MAYGRYFKAYSKTKIEAEVSVASPHRIIQMLFETLLERLSQAKGAIEHGDNAKKSENLNKSINIIEGLQGALNKESFPELYDRINELYDYMKDRLYDALTVSESSYIDEVVNLVMPIKEAWDQIPEDIKTEINGQLKQKIIDEDQEAIKEFNKNQ